MVNVIEIEQRDLLSNLESLKTNSQIEFTGEHTRMYNYLEMYTGESMMYVEGVHKFLVAKNEDGLPVGIGLCSLDDNQEKPLAHLDIVVSTEKGAGEAVVEAVIDYSRQMLNRTSMTLSTSTTLQPYFEKFLFVAKPNGRGAMVRQNSRNFDEDLDISKFDALDTTKAEVTRKRNKVSRGI